MRIIDCVTGYDSADRGIIDLTVKTGFEICKEALNVRKR